jgi:hypothetical protein
LLVFATSNEHILAICWRKKIDWPWQRTGIQLVGENREIIIWKHFVS